MENSENVFLHPHTVSNKDREKIKGHKAGLFWLTGLSGSGKSTIANKLESKLNEMSIHTYILDGDNIRLGLNKGLGFSEEDRNENIRRVCEVSKLLVDAGLVVLATFVSPLESNRMQVREILKEYENYIIYINTDLDVCKKRDPKGLYKLAMEGKIPHFPGVNMEFERPKNFDVEISNNDDSKLLDFILKKIKIT